MRQTIQLEIMITVMKEIRDLGKHQGKYVIKFIPWVLYNSAIIELNFIKWTQKIHFEKRCL